MSGQLDMEDPVILYREAPDCGKTKYHSIGEHGKPCMECGAVQLWVHEEDSNE